MALRPRRTDEDVRIGGDLRPLTADLQQIPGKVKGAVVAATAVIAGLVTGAIAGLARITVGAFREQERAEVSLRRALVRSGRYTAEREAQILGMSKAIQAATAETDESVLYTLTQMETIGNVADEQLSRKATEAVIGFARLTKQEVDSVSDTWAESLNQISKDFEVTMGEIEDFFSQEEVALIEHIKRVEGASAAQTRAIEIMHQKYAGFAETVEGSTDVYDRIGSKWRDFLEAAGKAIHLLVSPLAEWIDDQLPKWEAGVENVYLNFVAVNEAVLILRDRLVAFLLRIRRPMQELGEAATYVGLALSGPVGWAKIMQKVFGETKEDAEDLAETLKGLIFDDGDIQRINDAVEAARRKYRTRAGGADAGGAGIDTGAAGAVQEDISKREREARMQMLDLESRAELLRATLNGAGDAAREYMSTMSRIRRERVQAEEFLEKGLDAHHARVMEVLQLEEQVAQQTYDAAKAAEERALREDAEKLEKKLEQLRIEADRRLDIMLESRQLERELGRELDAEDLEYLQEHYRTKEEMERQFQDSRLQAILDARAEQVRLEREYGELGARVKQAVESKEYKQTQQYLASLETLRTHHNAKLARIGRAALRARIILDLATKPALAFAETAKEYPGPKGLILGGLQAAAIALQLGTALHAVGGGSGGGGHVGGYGGDVAETPDTTDARQDQDRPLEIHATIEVDGESIARVVQRRRSYSDDD